MSNRRGVKTLEAYIVGFILSLMLTFLSFAVAGRHWLSTENSYFLLMFLAVLQLFVQVVCFLRLNAGPQGRWNLMSFLFTIFIVLVLVIGSLWIMINLNYNMMH